METKNYELVDSVEKLEAAILRIRKAQQIFSGYTQEQVDKIFLAAASAANKQRIPLAKLAVEETGMGIVEDKVIKNHYASEYIYNAYKDVKTCGVIEENKAYGIKKVAAPIGVIAAVIPTTNPTSTAIFKTLLALKTRNGIIISPHPRAKKSTIEAAKTVLEAAVEAGAPEGIIGWIDVPSLEMTNLVMKEADIILATGGPGMVKAAYSSGKPALGVGAGNTPAIIDETADIILAVNSVIHSKTFDNGMICASEQSVIVHEKVYDTVKNEFAARGCYFLNGEETEKVRKTILINGALNAKIVGQKAHTIAKLAGVEVPEGTKILIGEVESVDLFVDYIHKSFPELEPFVSHNLSPMAAIAKYIKETDENAKVIFIGPCTAKKAEVQKESVRPYVDAALTFEELQALFDSRDIDITTLEEGVLDNASYFGRIFARCGGLSEAVAEGLKEQGLDDFELNSCSCDGIEACRTALLKKSKNLLDANFIEGMACSGGCIGGAGCLTHGAKSKADVDKYGNEAMEKTISDAVALLK